MGTLCSINWSLDQKEAAEPEGFTKGRKGMAAEPEGRIRERKGMAAEPEEVPEAGGLVRNTRVQTKMRRRSSKRTGRYQYEAEKKMDCIRGDIVCRFIKNYFFA